MTATDPMRLISAVEDLVRCKDLSQLAASAARLCQDALRSPTSLVVLRDEGGSVRGGQSPDSDDLEAWTEELLREGTTGVVSSGRRLAVGIGTRELGVRGVIAASAPASGEDEGRVLLADIGRLVGTCSAQIASREREQRSAEQFRASLVKGLHDLRTPLNSLRLGLHLLAPALATQEPSVVERTNRAVDRMAALVTQMFDSLPKSL